MAHGGGQGDSGGVGTYLAVGIQRTRCHRGLVLRGLDPRSPAHALPARAGTYPSAPHDPRRPVLELCYSDDRRPVALCPTGLERLLDAMCHVCWAAGGSVNTAKLKAFGIEIRNGRLGYRTGAVHPIVGRIPLSRGGLLLAGVPLLMGERPSSCLLKAEQRLRAVASAVRRLHPSYILSLRIVLSFAVSQLDYIHDACPPHAPGLRVLQPILDGALTHSLRVPSSYPKSLLHAPLRCGGFGAPDLASRFELRFVRGVLQALNSRNVLARRSTRQLLHAPGVSDILGNDLLPFHSLLHVFNLQLSLPPHTTVRPAAELETTCSRTTGAAVLLVSDGSSPDGRLGWGALVADTSGTILGTSCGGIYVDIATSWAAEWCGKLAAVRLADRLRVPGHLRRWAVADNVAAVLGPAGGRPSSAPVIDLIRLSYAASVASSGMQEGFTPAEHDSGWSNLLATLQARCHSLAAEGTALARLRSVPFLDLFHDHVLLFRRDRLVLSIASSLDSIYAQLHPAPPRALPLAQPSSPALLHWADVVEHNLLSPGALRLAALLRAAPLFPTVAGCPFHCSLCRPQW